MDNVTTGDVEITIDLDFANLTLGDLEDFENAKRIADMRAWLREHAGVSDATFRQIKVKQMNELREKITAAINAYALPKANGAH